MPTIEPSSHRRVSSGHPCADFHDPVTTTGRLILAVGDAQNHAETLRHPSAGPLSDLADALRDGDGEPETELIAAALALWFTGTGA